LTAIESQEKRTMKTGSILITLTTLALLAGVHRTAAQSTAFTYQGSLQESGVPFNGAGER